MNYLEGVYWDLDGTIANTELEAHLPAFNKAFDFFNINWIWDTSRYIELLKINGGKNRISFYSNLINEPISDELIIDIHNKKQYYYLKFIQDKKVILKTGVFRLVSELHKKEVRQFIVTSSSRKQVDTLIKSLFNDFNPFEFVIASEDVELHKPNPMPYLKAISLSGINIENTVVFEDSNAGLKSSLAAKLPTIYVNSNIPTVIDKDIEIRCMLDTLGDENTMSNVFKGPKLDKNFIDYTYLNKYLISIYNAKN